MAANTFGQLFRVATFGESHGAALGTVIDGCPAGVRFDRDLLVRQMRKRRPGQNKAVTSRDESDDVEILSGVFEGLTLGSPIAMMVRNRDARSQDYDQLKDRVRVGHADDVWSKKFGHRDHRGGGRASGRETVSRVMAGAVAQMLVQQLCPETQVEAKALSIGYLKIGDLSEADELLIHAKEKGLSYGGIAELRVRHTPPSLGQPVFRKFKSDLTSAIMGIGATTGVELGHGFEAAQLEGTEFHSENVEVYGGIRGGITTGEDLIFRVAFKPTASVMDVAKKGRHDPCIVPRALPVLEAMSYLVLADHLLWSRLDQIAPMPQNQ